MHWDAPHVPNSATFLVCKMHAGLTSEIHTKNIFFMLKGLQQRQSKTNAAPKPLDGGTPSVS